MLCLLCSMCMFDVCLCINVYVYASMCMCIYDCVHRAIRYTILTSSINIYQVRVLNEKGREKVWEFDEVFDFNTRQQDVYNDVSALVTSVLDGFNVCIFAYGQTGRL